MNEGALKSRSVGSMAFDICNYLVLAVVTLTVLYPFWNLILISFAEPAEMMFLGFHIWLDTWSTTAWQYVLEGRQVGVGYFNSLFRTVIGTPFTLVVTLFAAYPLSKRSLPYRKWITIYFVVPMLFSGGIIPTYLVVRGVGLIDSRLALILPSAVNVFYVIIMRNYLMTIDDAVEGIGAGGWRGLWHDPVSDHCAVGQAGGGGSRAVDRSVALELLVRCHDLHL